MLDWSGDALLLEPTDTREHLVLEVRPKGRPKSLLKSSILYRGNRLDPDPYHSSELFYDPEPKVIFRIVNIGLNSQARRGDPINEWAKSTWKEN